MDGRLPGQEVQPGETFVYEFDADPFGLHLYHCHTVPLKRHIHKGLYGAFIIDPRDDRRPPADELVMVMNAFDTNFDAENEVYAVNTVANAYMHDPIRVTVGRLVRIYLVNITEFDLVNSLHLHGMFFDVFRTGTSLTPTEHTDTVMLVPGRAGDSRDDVPVSRATSCSTRTRASSRSWDGWDCSGRRPRAVTPERDGTMQPASMARGEVGKSDPVALSDRRVRLVLALLPLVLLGALLAVIVWSGPADAVRGDGFPAGRAPDVPARRPRTRRDRRDGAERRPGSGDHRAGVRWTTRSGRSPPTAGRRSEHLGRTTLRIPYPWVQGEAHVVRVLTSTGTAFEHEIPVAVETPRPSARFFGVFTLIGLYVGVIPVVIGLLWFPFLSRLSAGEWTSCSR